MLPLTKLIRTIGGGFRREKMAQTVTWLCGLPKEFAIWLVNKSVNVKRSKCQSTSHGFSWYSINPVVVIGSKSWHRRRNNKVSSSWTVKNNFFDFLSIKRQLVLSWPRTDIVVLLSWSISIENVKCFSRYQLGLFLTMAFHYLAHCGGECYERLWSFFIYSVSQKNIPDVFSYNSTKHWRIFIIFGRNVTEKECSHTLL